MFPSRQRFHAAGTITSSPIAWRQALLLLLLALITACSSEPEEPPATANKTEASTQAPQPAHPEQVAGELERPHDPSPSLRRKVDQSLLLTWFSHEPQHDIFDPKTDWYYHHSTNQSFESLYYGILEPMHDCFDPNTDLYYYHAQNKSFDSLFYSGPEPLHSVYDPAVDKAWKKKLAAIKKKKKSVPKRPKFKGKTAEEQFPHFADYWLDKVNRNFPHNSSRMQITEEHGNVIARYRIAEKDTLNIEVKPSKSSTVPFVGIMRYFEHLYRSEAPTEEEARKGPFQIEKRSKITEIFSYSKGNWRE